MGWGDTFADAYAAASDAAKAAADATMSSARAAADAVARASASAAQAAEAAAGAVKDAAVAGAVATRDAAVAGAAAARDAAVAAATAARQAAVAGAKSAQQGAEVTARGAANVAGFGARVVGEVASAGGGALASGVTAPYRAVQQLFSPAQTPTDAVILPCPTTWPAKKARLEKRHQLIGEGRRDPDPARRAAAARLAQNNEAVELARLSDDSYQMAPPKPGHTPPPGWSAISDAELESIGISPDALADSRAVVYRSEPDWPGGQKTVLAFRGTADLPDGIVDHDQAMGLETRQYEAAMLVGRQVMSGLGPDVQVTGHSLGGGKAQAAGAVTGLRGEMFNSAGLNRQTVDGMTPAAGQFRQYRTAGDPLTSVQNSAALQTGVAALASVGVPAGVGAKAVDWAGKSLGYQGLTPEMLDYADKAMKALPRGLGNLVLQGNVLPPAIGAVQTVQALDGAGKPVDATDLIGQHSIQSVINGIEAQKSEDLATLGAVA